MTFRDCTHTYVGFYKQKFALLSQITENINFVGGAWTDKGFSPGTALAEKTLGAAAEAVKEAGVKDAAIMCSGSDGGECSVFAAIGTAMWFAEKIRG